MHDIKTLHAKLVLDLERVTPDTIEKELDIALSGLKTDLIGYYEAVVGRRLSDISP